jgi:hypothetical protein
MSELIIPPHTRTIFIQFEEKRFLHLPQHNKQIFKEELKKYKNFYKEIYELNRDKDGLYFKFKLNLPQLEIKQEAYEINETTQNYAINPIEIVNNKKIYYYSPLLNTDYNGTICMGKNYFHKNIKTTANDFFNSYFNTSLAASARIYVNDNSTVFQAILDFYQNWEETGYIELIQNDYPTTN